MRAYTALTTAMFKSQMRDPVGFFFMVIFSPALLLFLGFVFGNDPAPEFGGQGAVDNMTPGLVIMSILITGTTVIAQNQLILRSSGALTRLKMTPLKPSTYYAADMTVNALIGLIGPVLTTLCTITVFAVDLPKNFALVILAIFLGLVAFLAFGYAFAAVCPSVGAAVGLGNMLMILFMVTSGAFVPIPTLSEDVQHIFKLSPSYQLAHLVGQSWNGETWSMTSVLVLVGMAIIFSSCAALIARQQR